MSSDPSADAVAAPVGPSTRRRRHEAAPSAGATMPAFVDSWNTLTDDDDTTQFRNGRSSDNLRARAGGDVEMRSMSVGARVEPEYLGEERARPSTPPQAQPPVRLGTGAAAAAAPPRMPPPPAAALAPAQQHPETLLTHWKRVQDVRRRPDAAELMDRVRGQWKEERLRALPGGSGLELVLHPQVRPFLDSQFDHFFNAGHAAADAVLAQKLQELASQQAVQLAMLAGQVRGQRAAQAQQQHATVTAAATAAAKAKGGMPGWAVLLLVLCVLALVAGGAYAAARMGWLPSSTHAVWPGSDGGSVAAAATPATSVTAASGYAGVGRSSGGASGSAGWSPVTRVQTTF